MPGASSDRGRTPVDGTTIQYSSGALAVVAGGAGIPTYASNDVTRAYANEQVIAQGYPSPVVAGASLTPGVVQPRGSTMGSLGLRTFGLLGGTSSTVAATCPPGCRTSIKGRYIALADTPIDATVERFYLGLLFAVDISTAATSVANETETTRDNVAAIAAVVTDAEAVMTYNCAAAGDASYTDPSLTVDLSAGIYWEIIVEYANADNTNDDLAVTIKINGTTVLSTVAPVNTGTTAPVPILGMNQDALASDITFKIEKVA